MTALLTSALVAVPFLLLAYMVRRAWRGTDFPRPYDQERDIR